MCILSIIQGSTQPAFWHQSASFQRSAKWTLSVMTSQHKNGCDCVGTLYRVALGEVAFSYHITLIYSNKEQGMVYLLTYKVNLHRFISL